jgi:polyisoprenoid-binding protein YceI
MSPQASWRWLGLISQTTSGNYPMTCRLALIVALALVAAPLCATTYTFEPNYTQGVFRWDHLGFSHPAAQFSQVQGTLDFD